LRVGPARGPWTNLGRLPLRVFSIGKYAFQKKGHFAPMMPDGTASSSRLAAMPRALARPSHPVAPTSRLGLGACPRAATRHLPLTHPVACLMLWNALIFRADWSSPGICSRPDPFFCALDAWQCAIDESRSGHARPACPFAGCSAHACHAQR
jgi:hypothetical protein